MLKTYYFIMNELLVVLLAVCLFSVVSAQILVKRDDPTADEVRAKLNVVKNKITELGNNLGKQIADAIKPEEIKQKFNDAVDVISKALENFKAAGEAKPAAAQ